MLIIIWILLIACGILFPRSKILLWFMLSFMIVSIGCRTQGADYISYSLEFQWAATQKLTDVSYPGFVLVAKIAHQYGLSFESFVFTVATFSCVLFYIGIKRLTSNENLLMALFLFILFPRVDSDENFLGRFNYHLNSAGDFKLHASAKR